jgi:hypothetical protein
MIIPGEEVDKTQKGARRQSLKSQVERTPLSFMPPRRWDS